MADNAAQRSFGRLDCATCHAAMRHPHIRCQDHPFRTAESDIPAVTPDDAWDEGYRAAIEDYGCDIPWGGFTSKHNPYRAPTPNADARPEPTVADNAAQQQTVDHLAAVMHVAYEVEAARVGWETQQQSRVHYEALPEANKRAMRAGVLAVLDALYRDGWRRSET